MDSNLILISLGYASAGIFVGIILRVIFGAMAARQDANDWFRVGLYNAVKESVLIICTGYGLRGAVLAQGLDYYQEGVDSGRMAVAYLNGELDIAATSISRQSATALVVNLDAAAAQNVAIPQELLDVAGTIVEDGEATMSERMMMGEEEMAAATEEFLAGLTCTEELIAEQQAMLDAEAE